ncbi:MAG: TIGR03118 family protein [Methylococcaceae bacterium]|nr:TIGR03118 family protein [Methylococcaceae bacterium]
MNDSMQTSTRRWLKPPLGLALSAVFFIISGPALAGYVQHNLVTDDQRNLVNSGYAPADHIDSNLVNPWGIARSASSPFWVSDNGTGVSTLYNGLGNPLPLVVTVPGANPTGQVFNGNASNFLVNGSGARFLFATEAGILSGWNGGTSAITVVDNSARGAIYKGLAIDDTGGSLYAANFGAGTIDSFDHNFSPTLAGMFTDPTLPAGYAPFNIQNLGGQLFVAYAFKANPGDTDETAGAGLGIVDVFDTQGKWLKRLINNGSVLDAPWGVAIAPSDFGEFSHDLLIGNFGDGLIHAFDPSTGVFEGTLSDTSHKPIKIDGLWGLSFGNGGQSNVLYFAAGINDEAHGLFGSLSAVNEPATLPLLLLGLSFCFIRRTKR